MTKRSRRWLVLALLFVLIRAVPNLTYPIGRAQATYGVVAQGLLYQDIWDIKPPAIFWVYEGIVKLLGPVMWSVGAVDIVWLLAISWCIFRFAERYLGTAEGVIAVLINASWHCDVGYLNAVHAEAFLVLFVFVAYFQVWREGRWPTARHFLAGLLIGIAFWFKYNAVAFLPFLLFVPYLDLASLDAQPVQVRLAVPWRVWRRRSLALLGGLAATVAGVLGYDTWDESDDVIAQGRVPACLPGRTRSGPSLRPTGRHMAGQSSLPRRKDLYRRYAPC